MKRGFQRLLALPVMVTSVAALIFEAWLSSPPPRNSLALTQRLADFPTVNLDLAAPVELRFNDHAIPFITAESDHDLAYAIGLVHAHLRLGQMEFLRRVSQGRISEMAGPLTTSIDHLITVIELDRAVPAMEAALPDETRRWLTRYVQGINAYAQGTKRRPVEAGMLGLKRFEPWTVRDVLTFSRLAGADINWGTWLGVLPLREEQGYDDYTARLRAFHLRGSPSFGPGEPTPLDLLTHHAKSGSNAWVVAGHRSASGGALMATDPHVGVPQPALWMAMGYRTPDRAVTGLMIPGLPFVLLGRNEHIAWSGTNMQALSSALIDVEGLPLETVTRRIKRRLAPAKTLTYRRSAHGPVVTDAPIWRRLPGSAVALQWRGHEPSDETSAFLRLARARNFEEFRGAFATYAVSGQNFLYADTLGNIGQVLAYEFRPAAGRAGWSAPVKPLPDWDRAYGSMDLPYAHNPPQGVLVSANNIPILSEPRVMLGGNANDRVDRLHALLAAEPRWTLEGLRTMQRDTLSLSSLAAARQIAAHTTRDTPLVRTLRGWDGRYDIDSAGAYAYVRVMEQLLPRAYAGRYGPGIMKSLSSSVAVHDFVREDLASQAISAAVLDDALIAAERRGGPLRTWGDVHRLQLAHPLGRVPVLGRAFHFGSMPSGGALGPIYKAAGPLTASPHSVTYGACARLVTDMADPDASYVVLLGGQDGAIGSAAQLDQLPLWSDGRMIALPLRPASVALQYPHRLTLRGAP